MRETEGVTAEDVHPLVERSNRMLSERDRCAFNIVTYERHLWNAFISTFSFLGELSYCVHRTKNSNAIEVTRVSDPSTTSHRLMN